MLKKSLKALEIVINSGVKNEEYFDKFCEELDKLEVDENKHDYSDLFERALMEKKILH